MSVVPALVTRSSILPSESRMRAPEWTSLGRLLNDVEISSELP